MRRPVLPEGRRGLSPRVRGKRTAAPVGSAGKSVYPRVCGGNVRGSGGLATEAGLSPRVRGKQPLIAPRPRGLGSIPACAGETVSSPCTKRVYSVYPRVCGGNSRPYPPARWQHGLSPRVRGKLAALPARPLAARSIPACAGETSCHLGVCRGPTVYPRVCGGNLLSAALSSLREGLSPRVRGKPDATPGRFSA